MTIHENIAELECLAESVLDLKRSSIPRRPIVIEFCGSPKSGKSSCVSSLDLFLRRNKFRTKILTERASVCPVLNKYDPYFNIWTVTSVIAELSEVLSNHPKDYDVVILDRGIFDALCWLSWLLKQNHFDEKNYESIASFLTMNLWRSAIDLIYVFVADPEVSLDREYTNLLTRKTGSIMRPEVLESFKNTIIETCREYRQMFRKLENYNTSKKGLNDVNYEVTKNILRILHDSTSEKIGYIDRSSLKETLSETFYLSDAIEQDVSLGFDVRSRVEDDDEKIQPIPILIITNKSRCKVLAVKKNKKQVSNSSPESEKILLYFGGHIREEDLIDMDSDNIISIIKYALHREIKEETGVDFVPPSEETNPLCIWVRSNDRSRKHLAICHVMEVNFDAMKFKLDKNEFITAGRTISGKVLDLSEICKEYDSLEEWSQFILKEIFQYQPPAEQIKMF